MNTKSPAMYKRRGKESSTGTSMVQALAMSRRYALPEHLQHKMWQLRACVVGRERRPGRRMTS